MWYCLLAKHLANKELFVWLSMQQAAICLDSSAEMAGFCSFQNEGCSWLDSMCAAKSYSCYKLQALHISLLCCLLAAGDDIAAGTDTTAIQEQHNRSPPRPGFSYLPWRGNGHNGAAETGCELCSSCLLV